MSLFRRALTTAAAVAGLALLGPAPFASAQLATPLTGDKDCSDFQYQEEAQAVLDATPGDPNGLDRDKNGIACESLPHRPRPGTTTPTAKQPAPATAAKKPANGTGQVKVKPVGGVATGGGEPEDDVPGVLVLSGTLLAATVSGGMVLYLRRRPS
ncbi:excalibur calcium-binding domain-containing protein [Amycolatopsis vancoresmycina]|uniref:Excalibur calcium-binding protein n=1 Tax=Amycolatopsis vancoresmycina DSM 44592 TaxID=1292037 RepID=R1FG29_9PSEU|nr:excalibur calcium-binding domain-containing protein [Amycolatopsis vancoresmycina]EOD58568.1 excalibur calcium-binding protein [Amycolatopsis vancoresmycina DSM 44592]